MIGLGIVGEGVGREDGEAINGMVSGRNEASWRTVHMAGGLLYHCPPHEDPDAMTDQSFLSRRSLPCGVSSIELEGFGRVDLLPGYHDHT